MGRTHIGAGRSETYIKDTARTLACVPVTFKKVF